MTPNHFHNFDVIVVGGGHAGIEAAYAAAKMGSKTLLVTLHKNTIGLMPCNPAIGGIGKGHLVYEISALGGLMPKLCSKTYLQARMLNTSKGPAVHGLRLQIDKHAYSALSQEALSLLKNLTIIEDTVEEILIDSKQRLVQGIRTKNGLEYSASAVVLTTGTFLNGLVHIGQLNYSAGRQGEEAVAGLSLFLNSMGLKLGRLKTGTPPRLLQSSIDFSQLEYQKPDDLNYLFEFYPLQAKSSHACYITHTNEKTHDIIKKNLHLSAMYNGNIKGIGPRYCPSIEDKIGRFPDKKSHHVFVEPEGANTQEIYPNGISTSLPYEVQKEYVRSIAGFQDAIIVRPGYAVEYDFVLPNQLNHTLGVKSVPGLFLAGQINGTTGYEEAASQGIIAGINAHLYTRNEEPFILERTESYIGILIDDLVTMSVDEPYRMFTSRAERRLLLRQDNSFLRLTEKGYRLGMVENDLYQDFRKEKEIIHETLSQLRSGNNSTTLLKLFGEFTCNSTAIIEYTGKDLSERAAQIIHAELRYDPYIKREEKEVHKAQVYKNLVLPENFNYTNMPGLSKELQQKLTLSKPKTIADAALIPGMTPAAVSLLIFKSHEYAKNR